MTVLSLAFSGITVAVSTSVLPLVREIAVLFSDTLSTLTESPPPLLPQAVKANINTIAADANKEMYFFMGFPPA
jgi:hypothetical protein